MFNTSSLNSLLKSTYILLVSSPFPSLVTSRWPLKLKLRLCSKRWSPCAKTGPPKSCSCGGKSSSCGGPKGRGTKSSRKTRGPKSSGRSEPVAPKALVSKGVPNVEPDVRLVPPSPVVVPNGFPRDAVPAVPKEPVRPAGFVWRLPIPRVTKMYQNCYQVGFITYKQFQKIYIVLGVINSLC